MITRQDKDFMQLLNRTRDAGDGWRNVSMVCWQLVESFTTPELLEIDRENRRVRFTPEGLAVLKYATESPYAPSPE